MRADGTPPAAFLHNGFATPPGRPCGVPCSWWWWVLTLPADAAMNQGAYA